MAKYHRLASSERYQIQALMDSGCGVNEVARILKRSPSSISRELKRNAGKTYSAARSAKLAEKRAARPKKTKITAELEATIRAALAEGLSPEQVCGCLKKAQVGLSYETVYKFVYMDFKRGGNLWRLLRRGRRWRRSREEGRHLRRCGQRTDRTFIEQRPAIVAERIRLGDFERDTMKGAGGDLLTIVDRKSKLVRIESISKKNGISIHHATVKALRNLHPKTITNDNGPEFCDHELTARELGVKIYFTHPYASWERGTNENTNGLIRQYFSRKTTPTPELARLIEHKLNNRPRKGLGYRTPNEVHGIKPEGVALAS